MHAFLWSADIFQNQVFLKTLSGIQEANSLDQAQHIKICLIRVYSVCLRKYDISDPTLVNLTHNFFYVSTSKFIYIIIHRGWSLA